MRAGLYSPARKTDKNIRNKTPELLPEPTDFSRPVEGVLKSAVLPVPIIGENKCPVKIFIYGRIPVCNCQQGNREK